MNEHSTVLFCFLLCLFCLALAICPCPWNMSVSLGNTSILPDGCPHRQMEKDEFLGGQSGSFTFSDC